MNFSPQGYYNEYWKKRLKDADSEPLPDSVPHAFRKYTAYGSILEMIPKGSDILDLGCGSGNVTKLYLKKGRVTGVDVSPLALTHAKKLGIRTVHQDLNNTPYPFAASSFDVVLMTDVLEHLLDPKRILTECRRLIKPDGKTIITVPNFARLGNRLSMMMGDPRDLLHFEKYGDDLEHFHWFTKPKLLHLLHAAGFRHIRFQPTGLKNMNFLYGLVGFHNLGEFLTVGAS
jgi:methionine biosynthesis protein MetW